MAISARELTLILRVQSAGANNIRRMAADLNSLEKSGLSLNERFIKASQTIGAVGRQLQLAGGIGTFALGLAANEAAKLQTSVTLAATQVGNTTAQVKAQATKDFQGILDQMTKFPQASDDMSKALYDIYSTLNVTGKQGIPILQQINKAATAGALTSQAAGSGLLSILSNFKQIPQTAAGAQKAFNTMFAAVRYGRVTMDQFATSLQTTAPAAKLAGQSLGSMAGTVAFLSRSLGANKASVGYARLVEVLSSPQMQDGLKKVGVNIDTQSGKLKSLDQVIQILVKRFPYLSQGGLKAINFFKDIGNIQSTIQARRAFATLVKDVGGYRMVLGKTVHDHNEFRKSYAVMAQSLGVQWAVFLNTLKSIAITIGSAVIPAFVQMSKPIREAVVWFQKLPQSTKDMIGQFAAFAAVGALVGGTLLTIVAGIAIAVASFGELAGAAAILGAGMATYIGFAAVGKKIYDNWNELGPLFEKFAGYMKTVFVNLGQAAKAFYEGDWNAMWAHLGDAITAAIPAVKTALDLILQSVIAWGKEFVTTVQGAVTAGLAGMFVAARMRGVGGAPMERGLSGLSGVDLLSVLAGTPGGPLGMASKASAKSDDLKAALAKAGGLTNVANFAPFMSANQKMALQELQAREKIDVTWKSQIKSMMAAQKLQRQGINDLMKVPHTTGFGPSNIFAAALGQTQGRQVTRSGAGVIERSSRAAGMALRDMGMIAGTTAAMGFKTLGSSMASAGKGLLTFIGFGNLYVGAFIAAAGATYLFDKALEKVFARTDKVKQGFDAATSFAQSSQGAAQASAAYESAAKQVQVLNKAVSMTKNHLANAKGGTANYRQQLSLLSQEQDNLAKSTQAAADAQQRLSDAMATSMDNIKAVNLRPALGLISRVRQGAPVQTTQDFLKSGGGHVAPVDPAQYKQAQDSIKLVTGAFKDNIAAMLQQTADGVQLTHSQMAIKASMQDMANTYSSRIPALASSMGELSKNAMGLVKSLGRVPTNMAGFAAFANSLPQQVIPAVKEFMKITGQAPSTKFTEALLTAEKAGKGAGRELAAFVGTMGKMPSQKQVKLLFNRPPEARAWITDFINKFHKLPTRKQVTIHLNNVAAETKKVDALTKKLDEARQKAQHFADVQAHRGGAPVANPYEGAVRDAQRALNKIHAPHLKGIMRFTVQGNAFKALPGQAKTAETAAARNLRGLGAAGGAAGTAAGTAFGANFSATASAGAHATVTVVINALTKSFKIGSPSKLVMQKVGDPILQGLLAPLKKKKDIQDAANTAAQTMIDAFGTYKSTFQEQMGTLFAGPTTTAAQNFPDLLQQKLGFGEKVNIKDLTGDLSVQVRTFSNFLRSLGRLDRRKGTSFGFIDAIRQLGPETQSEIDALLRATPRQLRRYERLWERSQKSINKSAAGAVKGQVAAWRKQGEAVALGFMQGMSAHSASMARYFKNLFLKLFHDVKHTHKSHSPSMLYFEEGVNVMKGFQLGVQHQAHPLHMNPVMRPVGVGRHHRPLVASVTNNYYNRTYNVYPQKNENLLTALRKHDHITRHRP